MAEPTLKRPVAILPPNGGDTPEGFGLILENHGLASIILTPNGRSIVPSSRLEPMDMKAASILDLHVVLIPGERHEFMVKCAGIGPVNLHGIKGHHEAEVLNLVDVGLFGERVGLCPVCWNFFVVTGKQEVERAGISHGEAGGGPDARGPGGRV